MVPIWCVSIPEGLELLILGLVESLVGGDDTVGR